ncbi:MAG: hypothetical protein MJZ23_00185 [Paludibacteraceae bacterium]|nr:hypothetical protein [Paludibacteraceae bacterium]
MSKWVIAFLIVIGGALLMSVIGGATGTQRGGPFATIIVVAVGGALYSLFHQDNKDDDNDSTLQK